MENPKYKDNVIVNLTFEFALSVIEYCEQIEELKKYIIARQLLKSGTSIGANVREAQNGESKADFLHKMKIAAKEVDETEYWLLLCNGTKSYPNPTELLTKLKPIRQILTKIIATSKNNSN